MRQCAPYVTHASLCPSESTTQTASRSDSVQPFCTAYGRVSSGIPRHVLSPKNCPITWGSLDTDLIHGAFLKPTRAHNQMASWLVQPFLHSSPRNIPILYNEPYLSPKIVLPMGVSIIHAPAKPASVWTVHRPYWQHRPCTEYMTILYTKQVAVKLSKMSWKACSPHRLTQQTRIGRRTAETSNTV